jgi:hypothetical protein
LWSLWIGLFLREPGRTFPEFVDPLRGICLRERLVELFNRRSAQRFEVRRCASVIGSSPVFHSSGSRGNGGLIRIMST